MKRLFLVSLFLVFLCAAFPVLAVPEKPPQALMERVKGELVHSDKCNFHEEKDVECLIYFHDQTETVWLLLFDDNLAVYKVISVNNKKQEKVEWCRNTVCI